LNSKIPLRCPGRFKSRDFANQRDPHPLVKHGLFLISNNEIVVILSKTLPCTYLSHDALSLNYHVFRKKKEVAFVTAFAYSLLHGRILIIPAITIVIVLF
jgi:hypothetical protein